MWPLVFVPCFGALASVIDPFRTRRRRFWLGGGLLLTVPAVLPVALVGGESVGAMPPGSSRAVGPLLLFVCSLTLIALPFALYRSSEARPDDSGDDDGPGPDSPPAAPSPPGGGIPLRDAEQSPARRRDHNGLSPSRRKSRRAAPEPERTPVRSV